MRLLRCLYFTVLFTTFFQVLQYKKKCGELEYQCKLKDDQLKRAVSNGRTSSRYGCLNHHSMDVIGNYSMYIIQVFV